MRLCLLLLFLSISSSQPNFPPESWKCKRPEIPGAEYGAYNKLVGSSCADLKDNLNQCCIEFDSCQRRNGSSCVDDHEICNAKVITGRSECASIANRLIRWDLRLDESHSAPESWKCGKSLNVAGGRDGRYFKLMKSTCADLKDNLNECCANFESCKGNSCVDDHEKCNAKVISGREKECSAIADKLVQKDDNKTFHCQSSDDAIAAYRSLLTGSCKDLTNAISDCCVVFQSCDNENGVNCVENHEECNSRVVAGREQECIEIAGKFIRHDKRRLPDKNWKCKRSDNLPGAWEQNYRDVIRGSCLKLKDGLSQCCSEFESCKSSNGRDCIGGHKICNTKVISGREKECSAIADKLVQKDDHKTFHCQSRMKGGAIAEYRSLLTGSCKDLTNAISDCCVVFQSCDNENGVNCVENHEECNSRVVVGRQQECIDIAGKLIRHDKRQFPDKDWKCKEFENLSGAWEHNYQDVVRGSCFRHKNDLSQCCENYNICSERKEESCIINHKTCNAKVISGSEKLCSVIADRLVQTEKEDRPPGKIIIYLETIVVYAKEQMEIHPIRFWLCISLTIISIICLSCLICCLCCAIVANIKKAEKTTHSSSKASSVRSDSERN